MEVIVYKRMPSPTYLYHGHKDARRQLLMMLGKLMTALMRNTLGYSGHGVHSVHAWHLSIRIVKLIKSARQLYWYVVLVGGLDIVDSSHIYHLLYKKDSTPKSCLGHSKGSLLIQYWSTLTLVRLQYTFPSFLIGFLVWLLLSLGWVEILDSMSLGIAFLYCWLVSA